MTTTTSGKHADLQFYEQQLDESAISMLGGKNGETAARGLAGNGFVYRHDWGARNGLWTLSLTSHLFRAASQVFVWISEGPTPNGGKFMGDLVYNVAPENGVVAIRVNIEWPTSIGLVVDYLVVDP